MIKMDTKEDRKPVDWVMEDDCYVFECPHCDVPIQVEGNQVNCRIFRHGQMKNTYTVRFSNGTVKFSLPLDHIESNDGTELKVGDNIRAKSTEDSDYETVQIMRVNQGQQVPSHASQQVCDDLVAKGLIWGCGKPFQLVRGPSERVKFADKCGYV
jgi:hypothetical protein